MRDGGWQGLGTCSVKYVGTEGWVETGDSGAIRVAPDSLRGELTVVTMAGTDPATHVRNFLDCVKSRKLTRANALAAAQAHVTAHAAYIMATLGRPLKFDPKTRLVPGRRRSEQDVLAGVARTVARLAVSERTAEVQEVPTRAPSPRLPDGSAASVSDMFNSSEGIQKCVLFSLFRASWSACSARPARCRRCRGTAESDSIARNIRRRSSQCLRKDR